MVRLKYVHEVNGCLYVRRVTTVNGKRVEKNTRLPRMDSPEFWDEYQRLTGGTRKTTMKKNSMNELISKYRQSAEYKKNAPNTKSNKDRYLDMIAEKWGPYDFTTLTRPKVLEYRDEFFDTPGKADNLVSTLSAMMGWAVSRELMDKNPCHKIERLADGEWKPWPQDVLDLALERAAPMLALAIISHYFTGQRIGDVVAMDRPLKPTDLIPVVQEKTGTPVWIPIHRDFWSWIERIPTRLRQPALLYGRYGQRFEDDALRDRLRTLMREIGYDYKFHGLRKNAVCSLLEVGCTTWEVSAITGQSPELVEYYAREVNRKKLALSAIRKWENGGA